MNPKQELITFRQVNALPKDPYWETEHLSSGPYQWKSKCCIIIPSNRINFRAIHEYSKKILLECCLSGDNNNNNNELITLKDLEKLENIIFSSTASHTQKKPCEGLAAKQLYNKFHGGDILKDNYELIHKKLKKDLTTEKIGRQIVETLEPLFTEEALDKHRGIKKQIRQSKFAPEQWINIIYIVEQMSTYLSGYFGKKEDQSPFQRNELLDNLVGIVKSYSTTLEMMIEDTRYQPSHYTGIFGTVIWNKENKNIYYIRRKNPYLPLQNLPIIDIKRSNEYREQGNIYFKNQNIEKAILCYNDSIQYNEFDYRPFLNRSFGYCKLNKFEEALKDIEMADSLHHSYPKILARKAVILMKMGSYPAAESAILNAIFYAKNANNTNVISQYEKIKTEIEDKLKEQYPEEEKEEEEKEEKEDNTTNDDITPNQ